MSRLVARMCTLFSSPDRKLQNSGTDTSADTSATFTLRRAIGPCKDRNAFARAENRLKVTGGFGPETSSFTMLAGKAPHHIME